MSTRTNKTILGLDPGTNISGYSILSPQGHLIDYGVIRKKGKLSEKLFILQSAVEQLFQQFNPTIVSIETQFVGKNPHAAIVLGMARGIVLAICEKYKVHIEEYAPSKIKLAICKNGRAKKYQIQKMVELLYNIKNVEEDAADAIAIATTCLHTNSKVVT